MATSEEHRQEAERLLAHADDATDPTQIEGGWDTTTDVAELEIRIGLLESVRAEAALHIAAAQVHATLAVAAALAEFGAVPPATLKSKLCGMTFIACEAAGTEWTCVEPAGHAGVHSGGVS